MTEALLRKRHQEELKFMKEELRQLKEELNDQNLPFGVDLALPKVGGGARKTNHDYTHGQLPELIDVIIESGASLFVSAVGIPPVWAIDKLHENGILVMNMIGSPRHVQKCLDAGVEVRIKSPARKLIFASWVRGEVGRRI